MLDSSAVLDRAFHALSDPTRRQMLDRLAAGPASVSELARPLQMSLAAVVQHVQVLEASGLLQSRKTGRVRTCALDTDGLRTVEQWLADRRTVWLRRLDQLGDVLDEQAADDREAKRTSPKQKEGTAE